MVLLYPLEGEEFWPSRNELTIGLGNKEATKKDDNPICGMCSITVPSLRELFRGDKVLGDISFFEDSYIPFFFNIEKMLVERFIMDNSYMTTDEKFIDIYSILRRKPDGKSIGRVHDNIWRNIAFFLITRHCSQGEYEAFIRRLEQSARAFHMNCFSINYYNYLLDTYSKLF